MYIHYSKEKNVQMLLYLLKVHGIRKIVISPGTTNICFVGSVQNDKDFECYSCVDERSAAYMACGLAEESGEAVALSCTGATASRNYYPGLTEAFYRKLPVLAITSTRSIGQVGQNIDQVTDRSHLPHDIVRRSVYIPIPETADMEWENNVKINAALIDLKRHGGGPVHINLMTSYADDFSVKSLPKARVIRYYSYGYRLPALNGKKVGIFIGAHKKWDAKLVESVDAFCKIYKAPVFVEPESNYPGEYGIPYQLITWQRLGPDVEALDVVIHIGDVAVFGFAKTKDIWRVCRDGEVRDTFRKLTAVFEMEESDFFQAYSRPENTAQTAKKNLYAEWRGHYKTLYTAAQNVEIPFSNLWIARRMHKALPAGSELHLGILNSVRSWTLFDIDKSIHVFCNTGGYGIDGGISSFIGSSLVNPQKLYFGVFGDLAFFYDMNALGNRHIGGNIRLMVVNNGMGGEFKNHMNLAMRSGMGEHTNQFISAAGHYGNQSRDLVRHYATDLGFQYITAEDVTSFEKSLKVFLGTQNKRQSIVWEVFTTDQNDADAVEIMQRLESSAKGTAKEIARQWMGERTYRKISGIVKEYRNHGG